MYARTSHLMDDLDRKRREHHGLVAVVLGTGRLVGSLDPRTADLQMTRMACVNPSTSVMSS